MGFNNMHEVFQQSLSISGQDHLASFRFVVPSTGYSRGLGRYPKASRTACVDVQFSSAQLVNMLRDHILLDCSLCVLTLLNLNLFQEGSSSFGTPCTPHKGLVDGLMSCWFRFPGTSILQLSHYRESNACKFWGNSYPMGIRCHNRTVQRCSSGRGWCWCWCRAGAGADAGAAVVLLVLLVLLVPLVVMVVAVAVVAAAGSRDSSGSSSGRSTQQSRNMAGLGIGGRCL